MTYIATPDHKNPNPGGHEIYNFGRPFLEHHKVINEIRYSSDNYNKKLTAQINNTIPPGKCWRIIKSLAKLNNKRKPLTPLKINGQTLFHPIEKPMPLTIFSQVFHVSKVNRNSHLRDQARNYIRWGQYILQRVS